jgi:hypothetical protein
MSTQYRLVESGKTASGGCSAGQGSSEPVATRIIIIIIIYWEVRKRIYGKGRADVRFVYVIFQNSILTSSKITNSHHKEHFTRDLGKKVVLCSDDHT